MKEARQKIVVAFFIDQLTGSDGTTGGTERQLIELINHIDKEKYSPLLIALRGGTGNAFWSALPCEKYLLNVTKLLSIHAIFSLIRIAKILKTKSVALVQTFFFDATMFGVLAGKLAGVECIISSRRDMGFWYRKSLIISLKFINKITTRVMVNSGIICTSVATYENLPRSKVDVIYNGLDLRKIDTTSPDSEFAEHHGLKSGTAVYGLVANFNRPVKRVDLFIRAARIALDNKAKIKFVIVGGGKQEAELRCLTKNLNLEHNIVFAGMHDNPLPIMKLFSVGCLTSDSEGTPNTILQYMGIGIPTISTMAGGVVEILSHRITGLLVPCGDIQALADAFVCLTDKRARCSLGRHARAEVLKYDWSIKIKEYESYYNSLIADH